MDVPDAEAVELGATGTAPLPENLILFSDGTGNSSAKLFRTNVWRMYEAVDLGPSRRGGRTQVAYYDNGIGTQAIRFLAVLTGIFGIGLKSNVLRLYRFACSNVTPECRIYCFGFSRGAFTIRLVAAILAEYGVVNPKNMTARQFHALTLDVFREFMRKNKPNVIGFTAQFVRWLRDRTIDLKRAVVGPNTENLPLRERVNVHFIGVWDTVAAYGGPIAEITRGIDDYLWPLSMTDTTLHRNIAVARHALAIDDERDAFWPVLWDEVAEVNGRTNPEWTEEQRARAGSRLKQVWFAGMHSDVGGGYPDESLSYVSLCWMMDEAEAAGLRLLPSHKLRVRELANSLGPIHDSRGGLGFYYRPQPRKIAAFVHPKSEMFALGSSTRSLETETLSMRDPIVGELPKPPHGVLLSCRVHASVVSRLVEATNGYAPPTLPPKIEIEPYSKSAEGVGGNPLVEPPLLAELPKMHWAWYKRQERLWDGIFWRRVLYFCCAIATVLLVTMPLWAQAASRLHDGGQFAGARLTSWSAYNPFSYIAPYIRAFQQAMGVFLLLAVLVLATNVGGAVIRANTVRHSRALWDQRLARLRARYAGNVKPPWNSARPNRFTRWRTSKAYQRSMQIWKWGILPPFFALLLVVVGLDLLVVAVSQLIWSQMGEKACVVAAKPEELRTVGAVPAELTMRISTLCKPSGYKLKRGHRYEISWRALGEWKDLDTDADVRGVATEDLGIVQLLAAPARRVVDAAYLGPVMEIRPISDNSREPVELPIVHALDLRYDRSAREYETIIQSDITGELFFYVNDSIVLGQTKKFYDNNIGSALIRIRDVDAVPKR